MKSLLSYLFVALTVTITAQQIKFEQYKLKNGLSVILHRDTSAPVVVTSVMYHVGSKDEKPDRTGFAHFFEHLLFEGTKHIGRGEWFKIVSANGGKNNANTTWDRTYYYEVFPSNNLQLGLWMESERMLHPVINQIGVDTQRGVIKEERRLRQDNQPYGNLISAITENMFKKHPYRWPIIGSMEDLDAATLEEFQQFFADYYKPSNAVLVVAGDFDPNQAKKWIKDYFEDIPDGPRPPKVNVKEDPITEERKATWEDPNIQIPMLVATYLTPSMKTRDARILDMISSYLSNGESSKLYKKIVDDKKMALSVGAVNLGLEDYGIYAVYSLPLGNNSLEDILKECDEEIKKLQTDLISDRDFQKLKNQFESRFVSQNSDIESVASSLATYHLLYGDANLINSEIEMYRSITKEEIREVARKYLNPNQRVVLHYVPAKS